MTGLESAIQGLQQAIDSPRKHHLWRWLVRNRMISVREALTAEKLRGGDAWLAARELALHRERKHLLRQLSALGPAVLEADDIEGVRRDLQRLISALEHHRQRLNDLVYDSVLLELGGSE